MSIKKILILLLFVNFQSIYASELTVFNVGQGNCNLFVPRKGIPVLYDAGSTKSPADPSGKKINRVAVVREISDTIQRVMPHHKTLNVVVSHGDTDHYSYILDILRNLGDMYKFHFYLGGKEEHYSKKFIEGLKRIPKPRCLSYHCAESYTAVDAVMPVPVISDEYTAEFLAKLAHDDKNASSLVLRIAKSTVPQAPLVLLMGDATNMTTEPILEEDVRDTTILIANHHGSDTHGSNNQAWVNKSKPEITIFSARESSHEHPRSDVVSRYHDSPRLRVEWLHEFSYSGSPIGRCSTFVTYHEYPSGAHSHYRALTRKAMFNTMNEGTMTLKLERPGVIIRLDKPFFSTFPMKGLALLDLSAIEMINPELLTTVPKLSILKLLKTFHLHSNLLALTETEEKGKEAIDVLHGLLKDVLAIRTLSLWGDRQRVDSRYVSTVITGTLYSKLRFTNEADEDKDAEGKVSESEGSGDEEESSSEDE